MQVLETKAADRDYHVIMARHIPGPVYLHRYIGIAVYMQENVS